MKILFLDRDGIINVDTGFICRREEIEFIPSTLKLMHMSQDKGYIIVIVSNQSGIARGVFTEKDVRDLHMWMRGVFFSFGIKNVKDIYYCPYHTEGAVKEYTKESTDRKPNPGMILKALDKHGAKVEDCIMVGDKPSDRINLKGLKSVIVKSSYTNDDYDVESTLEVIDML